MITAVVSDNNIQGNVRDILEELVAHFGQKIHTDVLLISCSNDKRILPFEDSQQHVEASTPEISRLWLDRLLAISVAFQSCDQSVEISSKITDCDAACGCRNEINSKRDDGIIAVLCEWIRGYEGVVRPHLFLTPKSSLATGTYPKFDKSCIFILKNYEMVMSLLLNLVQKKKNAATLTSAIPSLDSKENLFGVINLLATDVKLLSIGTIRHSFPEGDSDNHIRKNEGIPSLLKIFGNTIETLQHLIVHFLKNDNGQSVHQKTILLESFERLRLCAVTLLAFDTPGENYRESSSTESTMRSPHTLAPSLFVLRGSRGRDVTVVQQMMKQFDTTIRRSSYNSSINLRRYMDEVIGLDVPSNEGVDDDYWNSLLSTTQNCSLTTTWIDPNPNSARPTLQIVQGIWCRMASLLTSLLQQEDQDRKVSQEHDEEFVKASAGIFNKHREQRDFVLKTLGGPATLFSDVRAHVFGRDLYGMQDLMRRKVEGNENAVDSVEKLTVTTRMGRVIEPKHNVAIGVSSDDCSVYERMPFRAITAINAFRLLLVPAMIDDMDKPSREKLLEDVFAICAALLDSNNETFGTFGAIGFLCAIEMLKPLRTCPSSADIVPVRDLGEWDNAADDIAWTTFLENTLTVLDRGLQCGSFRDHALVAIGRAQSRLFEIALFQSSCNKKNDDERKSMIEADIDNRFRRKRRIVTEHWLLDLEQSLHRSTTERQHLNILKGAVIPLLSQHAMDERFEADGIEVGRLGLQALLPLTIMTVKSRDAMTGFIEGDVGRETQMASMVALVNLIFAAHPIIAGHGGKIMSHLLVAATTTTPTLTTDTSTNENKEETDRETIPTSNSIRRTAILVAAITLFISESKFALDLLESIENDREQYQEDLLAVASEVRELASNLAAVSRL